MRHAVLCASIHNSGSTAATPFPKYTYLLFVLSYLIACAGRYSLFGRQTIVWGAIKRTESTLGWVPACVCTRFLAHRLRCNSIRRRIATPPIESDRIRHRPFGVWVFSQWGGRIGFWKTGAFDETGWVLFHHTRPLLLKFEFLRNMYTSFRCGGLMWLLI